MKIKDNRNDKINTKVLRENKISFNFMYLTNNKSYNLDYFRDKAEKLQAYTELYSKMQELSKITMQDCRTRGKVSGSEAIPLNNFKDTFKNILKNVEIVSNDSKLAIIRFNQNKYRTVCKQGIIESDVLYIIGFDFDYSAYNHG